MKISQALISITTKARALIKDVTPESAAIYKEIEKKFGVEQIEQLLDLLETLTKDNAD